MRTRRAWWVVAGVAACVAGIVAVRTVPSGDGGGASGPGGAAGAWRDVEPAYVGTATCARCHAAEAVAHAGSDHDRAMEAPAPASVVAPFDGRTVSHDGVETTFRTDGDRYVVRTVGPDGALGDYPVAWTFGVAPLQQYLLDLGDGRLQAFTVAWDDRPAADGGQRFYDLYPDEDLLPGDPLHWTGRMMNWNHVCADCHSTAYRKGYDADAGAFRPTWVEPDVGCEACHGPGARHVAWAHAHPDAPAGAARGPAAGLVVDLRNGRDWALPEGAANATPQPDPAPVEVETCAPCHSRRHQMGEARSPDAPLLDFYRPELLNEPALYFPDGQIDGEVYVYGSFVQSRMFHAGVRCSDCHDPHTTALRAEGDALCARCHDADVYGAAAHHRHAPGGPGSACVDCHMPARTYMGVDARRDHSIRVPRPDLAARLGTPDACTGCHDDRDAAWAAAALASGEGNGAAAHAAEGAAREQTAREAAAAPASTTDAGFAPVFAAARAGDPAAFDGLVATARDAGRPAIVRGTALAYLSDHGERAAPALAAGAADPAPLVRLGAVYGARGLPPRAALDALAPVLADDLRVLRMEAARTLSAVPVDALPGPLAARLREARRELLAAEALHADRPEAWLRVAAIETGRGRLDAAEAALRQALVVHPRDVPARVNLADLARLRGDEAAARSLLQEALTIAPNDAGAHHALGLLLVRMGRPAEALAALARAAALRPEEPRYAYVHAVALWSEGRPADARAVVAAARAAHPHDAGLRELERAYGVDGAR